MSGREKKSADVKSADKYVYQRIARRWRGEIVRGAFAPGSRLPSLDDMARADGVNRLTARKAVAELCKEGLVYSVPAQGTYVSQTVRRSSSGRTAVQASPVFGLLSHVLHPAGYGFYHQALISGINDELNNSEANLLVIAASVVDQQKLPSLMRKAHANAMIYLGQFSEPVLDDMVRNGPPAVLVDYEMQGIACDSISIDNVAGAKAAVKHLLDMGYGKDIAVISGAVDDKSTTDRMKGVRKAFAEAGLETKSIRVVSGNYSREGGEAAMRRLLQGGKRPRAVFCMNDEMAAGAMDEIRNAGLSVPGDIAIVGFDDSLWAETTSPQLTTLHVDARQMGRMAMKLLLGRINSPGASPTSTVLQPRLIRRGSA